VNDHYTSEIQFLGSVSITPRCYPKWPLRSPSAEPVESDPRSGFVVNYVSLQVLQNTLSGRDYSIGDMPLESSQPMDDMKFREARKYFQENKAEILGKYRGMFVAILGDSVADHDKEFSALAKRVYEKFGYQAIYMPFVQSEHGVLRIPSPRVGEHRVDALRKEV